MHPDIVIFRAQSLSVTVSTSMGHCTVPYLPGGRKSIQVMVYLCSTRYFGPNALGHGCPLRIAAVDGGVSNMPSRIYSVYLGGWVPWGVDTAYTIHPMRTSGRYPPTGQSTCYLRRRPVDATLKPGLMGSRCMLEFRPWRMTRYESLVDHGDSCPIALVPGRPLRP